MARGSSYPGGDKPHPYEAGWRFLVCVGVSIIAALLLAGCTTRTAGMQSPLAHDYDGLRWFPLDREIAQQIHVAPGYTALVENDPGTGEAELLERIKRLPGDIRGSEMEEIRLAVRPGAERAFVPDLTVQISINGASSPVVWEFEDLSFDGDWVVVSNLPVAAAGQSIVVTIQPAAGWEYGITPDRLPYGGSVAAVEGEPLPGALGFRTVFRQKTDLRGIASENVRPAFSDALTDPVLLALGFIVPAGGLGLLAARRKREGAA